MNTSQYKISMDELKVRRYSYEELLSNHDKRIRCATLKRSSFACAFIALLIIIIVMCEPLFNHNIPVTITAYAAENEVELSKDFVNFDLSARPLNGGSSYNDCYVNFNIYFKCEGEGIASITYTCYDQEVNRNNRSSAPAYYAENKIIPLEEYNDIIHGESFLYGYYVPGENTANVTTLIGGSYTVSYENQNDIQYGLVISATDDHAYHYSIEDTVIKLDILFMDGSVQHRKIIIKASPDAFNDVQLRIQ